MKPNFFRIAERQDWSVSISYASGTLDSDLTEWLNLVRQGPQPSASIMICGDDSIVIVRQNGVENAFEGDAGMYDQSQSWGPLWLIHQLQGELGVNKITIQLLRTLAANTYTVSSRISYERLRIDKKDRPLRDTGGADTTLGNSMVMGVAWFFTICHCLNTNNFIALDACIESFTNLGFDMKLASLDVSDATFLKGMWYDTDHGPAWGPLPSRILKMGKSLRHPFELHKTKTLESSASLYLNDVASSYSGFLPVPLIRKFVANFLIKNATYVNIIEEHQIATTGLQQNFQFTAAGMQQICRRYKITLEELLETEEKIPDVPFRFLVSRVYTQLALNDYA